MKEERMSELMPVTLITGFLGAGKTTLLEHIFKTDTGIRWAVIENESGNVGVDGTLMSVPSNAVFELNDGCVCCTVRDDLLDALEQIYARREAFDHVLIETTGLAQPAPVLRLFEKASIAASFKLMGVVTVVDAPHLIQSLSDVSACSEQIAFADLLILNKIDEITLEKRRDIHTRVRHLNPLAALYLTNHSKIDVNLILELTPNTHNLPDDVGHTHNDGHQHDERIRPVVVEADGYVDVDKLDHWLGELARGTSPALLRVKGILSVEHCTQRSVFNGVRTSVQVSPGAPWASEPRRNQIVLIGKDLDAEKLQTDFEGFVYNSNRSH
jgi:G3E family GTPase